MESSSGFKQREGVYDDGDDDHDDPKKVATLDIEDYLQHDSSCIYSVLKMMVLASDKTIPILIPKKIK